jgi:S1-C subfamily serine protease
LVGRGLVLTAAHVVGSAAQTKPSVRIAGLVLPATAVKEGAFGRIDLTLLKVDEQKLPVSLRLRRAPLCQSPRWGGQPVIVAIPEGTARSRIMSPQLLPTQYRARFSTFINDVNDVATTGNSGSGVFDGANKCLLGIMSGKITVRTDPKSEPKDLAKYFVPAETMSSYPASTISSGDQSCIGRHSWGRDGSTVPTIAPPRVVKETCTRIQLFR